MITTHSNQSNPIIFINNRIIEKQKYLEKYQAYRSGGHSDSYDCGTHYNHTNQNIDEDTWAGHVNTHHDYKD